MIQRCCIFRIAGCLSSCCYLDSALCVHALPVHGSSCDYFFDFDGWESTTYYYYLHYIDTSR